MRDALNKLVERDRCVQDLDAQLRQAELLISSLTETNRALLNRVNAADNSVSHLQTELHASKTRFDLEKLELLAKNTESRVQLRDALSKLIERDA